MGSNYDKGRRFEDKVKNTLIDAGYIAGRMAGSHGPFDIVAFNTKEIRLVQVKSNSARISDADREAFEMLPVPKAVTKEVWTFPGGRAKPIIVRLKNR